MILLLIYILVYYIIPSATLPLVNISGPDNPAAFHTQISPAWVSDPSGRGTWGLLYSCLGTLFVCVYQAIHLNIPPDRESKYTLYLRKVKWVLIAIFAPEIVAYTAFEQRYLGAKFLKKLKSMEPDDTKDVSKTTTDAEPNQDIVYAYYVMMGGFAADVSAIHNALTRVTFTTDGILFLASLGRTPRMRKDEIEDKSKSDFLGKSLVCLQVIWVIGQAIERKLSGYPTTMLEVHTIAHVVCALALYTLWWKKPYDVREPTILEFEGNDARYLSFMLELAAQVGNHSRALHPGKKWWDASPAYHNGFKLSDATSAKLDNYSYAEPRMVMYRDLHTKPQQSQTDKPPSVTSDTAEQNLSEARAPDDDSIDTVTTHFDRTKEVINDRPEPCNATKAPLEYIPTGKANIVCSLVSGQSLASGCGPGLDDNSRKISRHEVAYDSRSIKVSLSIKDVRRLDLAASYIKERPLPPKPNAPKAQKKKKSKHKPPLFNDKIKNASVALYYFAPSSEPLLSLRAPNMLGSIFTNISDDETYLSAAMAIVPAVYGSAHLGALAIIFPSGIERLLWKLSCYYLIGAAGIFGFWSLLKYMDARITRALKKEDTLLDRWEMFQMYYCDSLDGWKGKLASGCFAFFHYAKYAAIGIVASAYIGARMYLVVESFISLRHVPVGVYQTPSIGIMINFPHL